jgi:hypothetical protein
MSIAIICPSCGAKASAADAAAGKRAKCRACGTVIQIPVSVSAPPVEPPPQAPPPAPKRIPPTLCVRCATDVTYLQRITDDVGHAYCKPCWDLVNQPAPALDPGAARAPSVDPMHDDWARPMVDPKPTEPQGAVEELTNDQAPAEESDSGESAEDDFQPPATDDSSPEPQVQVLGKSPAGFDRARTASRLGYATASNNTSKSKVPDYAGLKWAASCFGFISLLNLILAVLAATALGIKISHDVRGPQFDLANALPNILGCAGAVISFLVLALIFRAISHATLAFRDIARNSWFAALGQLPH